MSQQTAAMTQFETELQAVYDLLNRAAEDLGSPLGDLVRAQVKRAQPIVRAALVLTVAVLPGETGTEGPNPSHAPQEIALVREQRILLAAALEMLYVALNVHRLLVAAAMSERPGSDDPLDRSFVGSTILAGDYCFSRAAQMAARTNHPRVVAIFAQALQNVSEGLLRSQFGHDPLGNGRPEFDDTRELLRSGAQAAGTLVDLSESDIQEAMAHSEEIATRWATYGTGSSTLDSSTPTSLLPLTHGRWQLLHQWLIHQRVNGKTTTSTTNHTLLN